mmetsp:Transcript_1710/g.2771  ORF Transcript_1710/g.2771 Transcript_1710/m.2771 type:complete len:229 (-) Transcript_1710:1254-1940(-)
MGLSYIKLVLVDGLDQALAFGREVHGRHGHGHALLAHFVVHGLLLDAQTGHVGLEQHLAEHTVVLVRPRHAQLVQLPGVHFQQGFGLVVEQGYPRAATAINEGHIQNVPVVALLHLNVAFLAVVTTSPALDHFLIARRVGIGTRCVPRPTFLVFLDVTNAALYGCVISFLTSTHIFVADRGEIRPFFNRVIACTPATSCTSRQRRSSWNGPTVELGTPRIQCLRLRHI